MKIIFDLRATGLGNNGGSSTLIKSGNTLLEMGHEVYFIDSGRNQHTWTPLKATHIVTKKNSQIPDADVIIATGYQSVASTVRAPGRCGLKSHWLRAWETWQMPEPRIVKQVLAAPTLKLVNSICLQNKLKQYKVPSAIIRPGYDLKDIYFRDLRGINPPLIIGGLYTKGKHEGIKRPSWIFKTYEYLKKKDYKVELWMFGNTSKPLEHVDKYFKTPSMSQKNWLYNHVDIWLAPAMLEGLHMPPAEAMMARCPVVSTDAPMSGTQDYMVHGETGLVSHNNLESFIRSVKILYTRNIERIEMGINARRKIESLGDRKYNMQKLVDYFMEKIS